MSDSIREKLGVGTDAFVLISFLVSMLLMLVISGFMPLISANPILSAVTLGFVLVLGSSVYLLKNYLDVRKLEAQPSAEELLKKQYVKDGDLDIQDYGDEFEKLKEIEEDTSVNHD